MNDLILITVSAIGGGIVGFFGCAALTQGKFLDIESELRAVKIGRRAWFGKAKEVNAAHTRCADALAAKNDRIDRALECVTENSAHVGKKMARILRGDA